MNMDLVSEPGTNRREAEVKALIDLMISAYGPEEAVTRLEARVNAIKAKSDDGCGMSIHSDGPTPEGFSPNSQTKVAGMHPITPEKSQRQGVEDGRMVKCDCLWHFIRHEAKGRACPECGATDE